MVDYAFSSVKCFGGQVVACNISKWAEQTLFSRKTACRFHLAPSTHPLGVVGLWLGDQETGAFPSEVKRWTCCFSVLSKNLPDFHVLAGQADDLGKWSLLVQTDSHSFACTANLKDVGLDPQTFADGRHVVGLLE